MRGRLDLFLCRAPLVCLTIAQIRGGGPMQITPNVCFAAARETSSGCYTDPPVALAPSLVCYLTLPDASRGDGQLLVGVLVRAAREVRDRVALPSLQNHLPSDRERCPPTHVKGALTSSDVSCHLVVSRPSTPTGPLAWMRPVLMPTSAPRPKRYLHRPRPGNISSWAIPSGDDNKVVCRLVSAHAPPRGA